MYAKSYRGIADKQLTYFTNRIVPGSRYTKESALESGHTNQISTIYIANKRDHTYL